MSTIRLMIKSDIYNCDWEFERRLNIIRGDSGIGKTTLVEILTNRPQGIEIYTSLPTVTVLENSWQNTLSGTSDSILLFDDISAVETSDFANLYKSCVVNQNNYVIAIARENQFQPGKFGRLSFSINAMYLEITDGTQHFLKKLYSMERQGGFPDQLDCCIVEDSGAGYHFFSQLLDMDVISAKSGKSAVIKTLIDVSEKYKNIFLIFDTAAFGCHMEHLTAVMDELDIDVYFMDYYECFEELLTATNFLASKDIVKEESKDLPAFANQFGSWEKYFINLAERASLGLPYEYKHGRKNLKFCYLHDCCDCNANIKSVCDNSIDGDKFKGLLQGTKYERLLKYEKTDKKLECFL